MAPEVVFAKPYDYTVDIWSLGVLLYELLHGKSPFKAQTFQDIYKRFTYEPQFTVREDLNTDCKDIIHKILKINPLERPSINEILECRWSLRMFNETNYIERIIKNTVETEDIEGIFELND
jgi:serine/threonine protein kinase